VFASRLRTRVFSVLFSFVIEFYAVCNQGIGLIFKTFIRTSVFFAVQIYIEPVLTSREECKAFEDLLTPMRNASNLRTFCFKDHHYELFCLSRDSYDLCHSLIRSSYFIQVYIFIPLIQPAPFLRFSHAHFAYTNFFHMSITMRNIFLFSEMTLIRESSEFNFDFSSKGPT